MKKDEEIIKKLYIELCNASINKDIKTIDEILSDNYILVHMTGMKQTKEDYINTIKNEEIKYYEVVHENFNIITNSDSATIIAKSKTLAAPFEMTKSWWRLKQEITLKKEKDKWKIARSVVSTY